MEYDLTLPFERNELENLRVYDRVLLSGTMLVARDQAHKRLCDFLTQGKNLPVSLTNETCYYMGPAATPPGMVIGSCGPTTSARMDVFTPALMDAGLVATIGKGPRNMLVEQAIARYKGLYLVAYGGCGALYAMRVSHQEVVAFADLGPEAVFRIKVEDFPAIVAIDSTGTSVFH